jgi:hypothetical protein
MMAWVDSTPMPAVRAIGLVEVLGAIGLILPPLTGVAPWLALAAAIGFVVLQIGATAVHLSLGERRIYLLGHSDVDLLDGQPAVSRVREVMQSRPSVAPYPRSATTDTPPAS